MRSLFRYCLSFALLAGCVADAAPEEAGSIVPLVDGGSPEEAGIVAFLNDAATTQVLLDDDVGLDRRAASNLIRRRDDAPFENIEQVDAVAYVGPTALQKLLDWARNEGWIETETTDRDAAILALVNDADTDLVLLDDDVGLDARAARNIIDARAGADLTLGTADDETIASIAALDAISYVGPSALDKLATYALANGYGEGEPPPPTGTGCAIISEYLEGSGNNNKAVEVFNCGTDALDLSTLSLCLVRNADTTCGATSALGSGMLAPGAVWTVCRTLEGTLNDPYTSLTNRCDQPVGSAVYFNGDDRLVLFDDLDTDGALGGEDTVYDVFGDTMVRPSDTIWAERSLRRCRLEPHADGPFDMDDYFTQHGSSDSTHFGLPPNDDCGERHVGAEGDDCLAHEGCAEGLRCYGRPNDGSTPYGKCIDTTPIPGEGATCDQYTPCAEGLICAGWTLWGEGNCNPGWMAGRYRSEGPAPIHDPPSGGIAPSVTVYGLASVPVDIEVMLHIDHPRPQDLRVTLLDPSGTDAVLWDQTTELEEWSRSFVTTGNISRDDEVNGRWHLRIEDLVAGQTGVWHEWSLFVVSRWD